MFKAWTASADGGEALARLVEAHINEYADSVVSVSYAVREHHHALVVYRPIEPAAPLAEEAAVTVAEHIIDEAQA